MFGAERKHRKRGIYFRFPVTVFRQRVFALHDSCFVNAKMTGTQQEVALILLCGICNNMNDRCLGVSEIPLRMRNSDFTGSLFDSVAVAFSYDRRVQRVYILR